MLNGAPIDPAGTYRVTMNNFLGHRRRRLPGVHAGTDENTGADDLVALEAFLALQANSPYTPPTDVRITRVPLAP